MSQIELLTEFDGASLGPHQLDGRHLSASLKEEPLVRRDGVVHDYNWHFVFGLMNRSDEPQQATIAINCQSADGLPFKAHILGGRDLLHDFQPLQDIRALTDTFKRYHITLPLEARETKYLSNTYFRSLAFVSSLFEGLAKGSPVVRPVVYGRSGEGRDLKAYAYGGAESAGNLKPTFAVTSGFHPMEADTFATEAIMEHLNGPAGGGLLDRFNFVVIPVVNPDGFRRGYNGCNARGINLYWDFQEGNKAEAPEAFHLWEYLRRIRPSIFIDFHAYTFQLHRKSASPYLKPIYFYRGREVQTLVRAVNEELKALHQGRYAAGDLTYAPSALPQKLTRELNTITYAKYHLHIGDGKEAFKSKAVEIVKAISGRMIALGFLDQKQFLAPPHGGAKDRFADFLRRRALVAWTFRLKILMIRILRLVKLRNEKV